MLICFLLPVKPHVHRTYVMSTDVVEVYDMNFFETIECFKICLIKATH